MSYNQSQVRDIFIDLDYLDDGYVDGTVSHVGLHRILTNSNEMENVLGTVLFTRLISQAEDNLYARMTFDQFLYTVHQVAVKQAEISNTATVTTIDNNSAAHINGHVGGDKKRLQHHNNKSYQTTVNGAGYPVSPTLVPAYQNQLKGPTPSSPHNDYNMPTMSRFSNSDNTHHHNAYPHLPVMHENSTSNKNNISKFDGDEIDGAEYGGRKRKYGNRMPRDYVTKFAVQLAAPVSERETAFSYLDMYSCRPPPIGLITISLCQVAIFVWHTIMLTSTPDKPIGPNGPVYDEGYLIFHPNKKTELWRYLTYMFVHSGYIHVVFNILLQLLLGIPLEMVHRWWRILIIYVVGVLAGSLASAVLDPDVLLAGASGGAYALLTTHLANVIFNWNEMEFAWLRLCAITVLITYDTSIAVYFRYSAETFNDRVSYIAHIAGAVVGLLLGLIMLINLRSHSWERVAWWLALLAFITLFTSFVLWNIALEIQLF